MNSIFSTINRKVKIKAGHFAVRRKRLFASCLSLPLIACQLASGTVFLNAQASYAVDGAKTASYMMNRSLPIEPQAVPGGLNQVLLEDADAPLQDQKANSAQDQAVQTAAKAIFSKPAKSALQSESKGSDLKPEAGYDFTLEADIDQPIHGQLSLPTSAERTLVKAAKHKQKELSATISSDAYGSIDERIEKMVDHALDNNADMAKLDKAVAHYRKRSVRTVAASQNIANYVLSYRGFAMSSEAGDIILGEKKKLKSLASAEYLRQKMIDETHSKVSSGTLQIAMGMGMADKSRGSEVAQEGYTSLKDVVGDEEASKTKELIAGICQNVVVPDAIYAHGAWTVNERQKKQELLVAKALEHDPLIQEITKHVHKYNKHKGVSSAIAHLLEPSLSIASVLPFYVAPAAVAALLAYVAATGGPEESKLLKELYLDKRLESRTNVITQELTMALDNYEIGTVTHNPSLIACSESIISEKVGEQTSREVLGGSVLPKELAQADGAGDEADTKGTSCSISSD